MEPPKDCNSEMVLLLRMYGGTAVATLGCMQVASKFLPYTKPVPVTSLGRLGRFPSAQGDC